MKKIITICALLIFMASTFSVVLANETDDSKNDTINTALKNRENAKVKIEGKGMAENAFKNRMAFLKLTEKGMEKLKKLNEKRLDKLANLEEKELEKISLLGNASIRKLTNLKEDEIKKIAGLEASEQKKMTSLGFAQISKLAKEDPKKINEFLKKLKIKKIKKDMLFKERVIKGEKLKEAKEKYSIAKQKYADAKDDFLDEKKEFLKAKGEGNETAALEHAKKYLLNAADVVLSSLEKVKERIESSEDLTEQEAIDALADINKMIESVKNAKTKVEQATTKEDIKEAGKTIINAWKNTKPRLKMHIAKVENSKIGEVIKRSERLEEKLNKVLAKMEEEGIQVEGIDAKVSEFSAKINEAKEKIKLSKGKFEEAKNIRKENLTEGEITKVNDLIKESRALAKEAHDALKEAHSILKDILKDIKEAKGEEVNLEDENEDEVEVVEEVETGENSSGIEDAAEGEVETEEETNATSST